MSTNEPHPDYPQNITPDEARLGFALHLVGELDEYYPDRWIPAVCKILSSSDIIVKVVGLDSDVAYSHRRFGFMEPSVRSEESPEWNPVGLPYYDCETAVFEAGVGASQEDGPLVKGCNAPIKDA